MLTRLLPEQVSKLWDIIKYSVEQSLPPIVGEHPDKMNRILSSILSGNTQCWVSYKKEKDNNVFEGVSLTKFLYDEASGTKNLLLYTVYGYEQVMESSWMEAFLAVAKYAMSQGCNQVVTYTNVPYLIDKAKKYGADADYTFISFDITKVSEKIFSGDIK